MSDKVSIHFATSSAEKVSVVTQVSITTYRSGGIAILYRL
jgi:hypothetical protein